MTPSDDSPLTRAVWDLDDTKVRTLVDHIAARIKDEDRQDVGLVLKKLAAEAAQLRARALSPDTKETDRGGH